MTTNAGAADCLVRVTRGHTQIRDVNRKGYAQYTRALARCTAAITGVVTEDGHAWMVAVCSHMKKWTYKFPNRAIRDPNGMEFKVRVSIALTDAQSVAYSSCGA